MKKSGKLLVLFDLALAIIGFVIEFPSSVRNSIAFKIASTILIGSAFLLTIRFVADEYKRSKKWLRYLIYTSIIVIFGMMLLPVYRTHGNEVSQPASLAHVNIINFPTLISAFNGNKIQVNSSPSSIVIQGDNNRVNSPTTYEINTPPGRKLMDSEMRPVLKKIASLDHRIRVSYPENNKEALDFSNQIYNYLIKRGYTNISKSSYGKSFGYSKAGDRFSVRVEYQPIQLVDLIINPKQ